MRHVPDPSRDCRRAVSRATRLDAAFTVELDGRTWLCGRGWRIELTDELLDELAARRTIAELIERPS